MYVALQTLINIYLGNKRRLKSNIQKSAVLCYGIF